MELKEVRNIQLMNKNQIIFKKLIKPHKRYKWTMHNPDGNPIWTKYTKEIVLTPDAMSAVMHYHGFAKTIIVDRYTGKEETHYSKYLKSSI